MKAIQITIDEQLLAEVDDAVQESQSDRSAFLREALVLALQQLRIRRLKSQHQHGYQRQPAEPDDFAAWEAEQVWGMHRDNARCERSSP